MSLHAFGQASAEMGGKQDLQEGQATDEAHDGAGKTGVKSTWRHPDESLEDIQFYKYPLQQGTVAKTSSPSVYSLDLAAVLQSDINEASVHP